MPVNNVQTGVIAQNEFAKLLVIGSDGRLEVSWPMTDDDRRDAEVHIGGKFGGWVSFQVKAATHLQRPQSRVTPMLTIPFTVPEHRLISDPRFAKVIGIDELSRGLGRNLIEPRPLSRS
jgi:hypothetical protein